MVSLERSRLSSLAVALLASAGLAACASTEMGGRAEGLGPRYPTRPSDHPPPRAQSGSTGYKVGKPYQVNGVWYTPREDPDYDEVGLASWYGEAFQWRPTASGELFDMYMPSAAHKTLPLPSIVEVTNLDNGKRIKVRVNDRGPFVDGRIIDLSRAAADELGMVRAGVARVRVRYVSPAPLTPQPPIIVASAKPAAEPEPTPIQTTQVLAERSPPVVIAAPRAEPAPPPRNPEPAFEVQAAAFADRGNAERARLRLADAGEVVIRPLERSSGVLYRVVVSRLADEDAALNVRDRLAALGFPDARVISPD